MQVQSIKSHESYGDMSNDIALIKLSTPFDFAASDGHIGTVCLPQKNQAIRDNVEVTGWGDTYSGKIKRPSIPWTYRVYHCLRETVVEVLYEHQPLPGFYNTN